MKRFLAVLTVILVVGLGTTASAALNNSQGFEKDTGDWVASTSITRVASGGGVLGVASKSGGYHAEVVNTHETYQPGFGWAGYTYFGGRDPVYHGDFFQALDMYIDTTWAPAGYVNEGLWLDMSPANTSNSSDYRAEHNFRLSAPGDGTIVVKTDAVATPLVALTSSGWYTFEITYIKGANPTDVVTSDMNVYDSIGTLLGSTTLPASFQSDMPSSDLGGNSYAWITVWQNNFAGDILAIDNAITALLPATGAIPEPTGIVVWSLLGALGIAGCWLRKRRKSAP